MVLSDLRKEESHLVGTKDTRDDGEEGMNLTFKDYQKIANSTAIYPRQGENFSYPALGLNGEAGEVAEHAKKAMRDDNDEITKERREKIKKELGDVLWYVAACCMELHLDMGEVAALNLDKLLDRKARGKLQGSGDDR